MRFHLALNEKDSFKPYTVARIGIIISSLLNLNLILPERYTKLHSKREAWAGSGTRPGSDHWAHA